MKKAMLLVAIIAVSMLRANCQTQTLNEQALSLLNQKCVSYPITFAVLGDIHCESDNSNYENIFHPILEEIKAIKPDFIIACGDIANDAGNEEYEIFSSDISNMMNDANYAIPFFCLPGNHDFGNNQLTNYRNHIGHKLNYKFDFGHSRFILLNNGAQPGDSWYDFKILDETIDSVRNWMKDMPLNGFVFAHVPLYEKSYGSCGIFPDCEMNFHGAYTSGPEPNYNVLHELNKEYNIRAFISGHNHNYKHGTNQIAEGVEYFVSGGSPQNLNGDINNHWLLFTINENAQVTVDVKWMGAPDLQENINYPFNYLLNHNLYQKTESSDKIYYGGNSIRAGNSYIINENANIKFVSGEVIKLQKGFKASKNSKFKGVIIPDAITCSKNSQNKSVLSSGIRTYQTTNCKDSKVKKKQANLLTFEIFPNPNNGTFNITFKHTELESFKVYVINVMGEVLTENYPYSTQIQIDISDQNKGIYFLKMSNGSQIYYKKIIKQ